MVHAVADRAVLFIVDGMRPDGLLQAPTAVLDGLMKVGAHTLLAKTVSPSLTLPCHASLFLASPPEVHGVTTNTWVSPSPSIPGIVEVMCESGRESAFFYNWEELRDLSRPGTLAASFYPCRGDDKAADRVVAETAFDWLGRHRFDFAFVYLGFVDIAGHTWGWMSDEYLEAISHADSSIGTVLGALPETTFTVVTSDHGGHEHVHGTDCDEDLTIPLILAGPGVSPGSAIRAPVSIIDIAPTILSHLGIDRPPEWSGIPIEMLSAPPQEAGARHNIAA
jgi:hypothetical protein